jgi:CIC family chloride channel protein
MAPGRFPLSSGLKDVAGLVRHIELRAVSRWVALGLMVGVCAGIAACALHLGFEVVSHFTLVRLGGLHLLEAAGEGRLFDPGPPKDAVPWVAVACPALGLFASSWLVTRFAPEAAGGNGGWLHAFHQRAGRIRRRVISIKLVASILSLGGGASAGREGPIAHIGAAVGSAIGRGLKLSDRERRLLLLAGAAGGIGAIFRTPLGGALFVVEVLYTDDLEADALVPAVLSSVVAYSLFTTLFGETQLFATPHLERLDPRELPVFVLMAIAVGVVGVLFVALHRKLTSWVGQLPYWPPLIALAAGGTVGLLSLVHPVVLGAGYGWVQEALLPTGLLPAGAFGAGVLLVLALLKVLATCLVSATSAAGGNFGPSMAIGGLVGGAFGVFFHEVAPTVVTQPAAYVIVGMACFVGGVARAPLSTLVMASEMTGSYELLVPTMLGEVITFTLVRRFRLYPEQVPTRRDSPAHAGEYVLDVLAGLSVRDVLVPGPVRMVQRSMPLGALLRQATEGVQVVFPVLGPDGRPEGMVTLETVRAYHYDDALGRLALLADCEVAFESVGPADTLAVALERMARVHYQQLPVFEAGDFDRPLGLISYDDLLLAYSRELGAKRRELEPPQTSL